MKLNVQPILLSPHCYSEVQVPYLHTCFFVNFKSGFNPPWPQSSGFNPPWPQSPRPQSTWPQSTWPQSAGHLSNHLRQRGSIFPSSYSISKNPFSCCPSLYGTLYALFSCICPTCLFAKTHQPLPPGHSLSLKVKMARFPFLLLLVLYLNPSSSSSSSSVLTINYEDENPPAPNPGFSVDRKRHTFLLDGLPFRYASGSAHYFRIPRALWRDRLRKLRAAGFNAVQGRIS